MLPSSSHWNVVSSFPDVELKQKRDESLIGSNERPSNPSTQVTRQSKLRNESEGLKSSREALSHKNTSGTQRGQWESQHLRLGCFTVETLYTKAPGKDLYLLLSTCVRVVGWLYWCWYCYTCKIEKKQKNLVIIKAIFSGSTLIFLKGVRFGSAAGHTWGEKQRLKCCLQQQSKSPRCKWALLCRGLVCPPVDSLQCCTATVRLYLLPTRPLPSVRWERLHGGGGHKNTGSAVTLHGFKAQKRTVNMSPSVYMKVRALLKNSGNKVLAHLDRRTLQTERRCYHDAIYKSNQVLSLCAIWLVNW